MNRQAMLFAASEPLQIRNNPIPEPPAGGLVVKTHFGGICHSDVHLWDNQFILGGGKMMTINELFGYKMPIVLGHEISGEVHSIGKDQPPGGPKLKIGDKILVCSFGGCCKCSWCKVGEGHQCLDLIKVCPGTAVEGGFGSYVIVHHSETAIKAPEGLPMDVGCLLACSGLTAYNAICHAKPYIEFSVKRQGSATLLIVGAGGLGLWAIQLAKIVLPNTKVVVADTGKDKLQTAIEAGADDTVLWDPKCTEEEIIQKTKDICGGGFDASIDFVNNGVTSSRNMEVASKCAANVCVGLFGGALTLPLVTLPLKNLTYHGVWTGSPVRFREVVELVAKHKSNHEGKPPPTAVSK